MLIINDLIGTIWQNCHWHDAIWLQKEKKLKQLQVVTYMPSKYLSVQSQQKKQWKTN